MDVEFQEVFVCFLCINLNDYVAFFLFQSINMVAYIVIAFTLKAIFLNIELKKIFLIVVKYPKHKIYYWNHF